MKRGTAPTDEEIVALAEKVASLLRGDPEMLQQRACSEAGMRWQTYYMYMAGERERDRLFQSIVEPAIAEQAQSRLADAEADVCRTDGKTARWHQWKLEKTHRKIFGDLATVKQVELSGPGGKPIETHALSSADIEARLAEIATGVGDDDEE